MHQLLENQDMNMAMSRRDVEPELAKVVDRKMPGAVPQCRQNPGLANFAEAMPKTPNLLPVRFPPSDLFRSLAHRAVRLSLVGRRLR